MSRITQLKKVRVSIDGTTESVVSAYTDFTYWNGWLNVSMTKEQLIEWMAESPYDIRFTEDDTAILYFEDEQELESVMIETEDGILPLYDMNGFCFSEVDTKGE